MPGRYVSGLELFSFLVNHGFRVCEAIGGDAGNVVMARDCANVAGTDYIGVPIGQVRLAETYLRFTLAKAGLDWEEFWKSIGNA